MKRHVWNIAGNGEDRGSYFGGKGGAGVWQTIINQIPPHDRFVEAFAGSATITRKLRRCRSCIVIDSDAAVCEAFTASFGDVTGVTVICGDAISYLDRHAGQFGAETVIYCDPPYLWQTRRGQRRSRYQLELGEDWLHEELLGALVRHKCPVLISGYRSELYDRIIGHWRRIDYTSATRGGPRTESLWCNFPEPTALHDPRYYGRNYREREKIKRRKVRWLQKLRGMSQLERSVLMAALEEYGRVTDTFPNQRPHGAVQFGIQHKDP